MNINGLATIRFNVYGEDKKVMWTASLSKENKDGSKTWFSVPVNFTKSSEEEIKKVFKETKFTTKDKKVYINVKKGFISGYKDRDNKSVLTFVIQEFEKSELKVNKVDEVTDEDVPF